MITTFTSPPLLNHQGAEIIRLYQTLLGRDGFRKGMDLYFKRHDGQVGGSCHQGRPLNWPQ